ncbi:XdhC family protein [Actinomycetospora sp. TBRC 11914]|uniref:XdhC family protein n=1 Tax=Actinomycetospora sp. TBRC 11914 TaxID=2729387 RepID=UPI00145E9892|nr:XdhC family protein [Actinomycetospora sp. TBRC 11914]NMO88959.1 XdhC family protein [Actinomycetospora sp. TBRC 11914]
MTSLLGRAEALREQGTPFVLATVVRVEHPTSARPGDRALVLADGTVDGFVGGHCAEDGVRQESLRVLASGTTALLRIAPEGGPVGCHGEVGLANHCESGGTLEILLEAVVPSTVVGVHGDGPIAAALRRLATALDHTVVEGMGSGPAPDAVVVASHGYDEAPVLEAALRAGVGYVALVASRRRGAAVLAGLDVEDADRDRVHTPAGLDLGATTPPEVALSVLAEMVAVRAGRTVRTER